MINLFEKNLAGTAHLRAHRITISNPYNGKPSVAYEMESVAVDASLGEVHFTDPGIGFDFDPADEFQMLDPATGDPIPGLTMTQGMLQAALFSLWVNKVNQRG